MTTTSTPDLSALTLRGDEGYHDYDHFQTSPPIIPGQSTQWNNPFQVQQKPQSRAGLPSVSHSLLYSTRTVDQLAQQQWLDNTSPRSLSPPVNSSDISSGGTSPPQTMQLAAQTPGPDDEIIPTAIVIKNIPFNVKRETLLDIIVSPYAMLLC